MALLQSVLRIPAKEEQGNAVFAIHFAVKDTLLTRWSASVLKVGMPSGSEMSVTILKFIILVKVQQ